MIMEIIILPLAESDLEDIYSYYASKSTNAAVKIFNSILDEMEILSKFPYIAAVEPILSGIDTTFRSLVVARGKFKVIYFTEGDVVYVSHVWNCRDNPTKLTKRK